MGHSHSRQATGSTGAETGADKLRKIENALFLGGLGKDEREILWQAYLALRQPSGCLSLDMFEEHFILPLLASVAPAHRPPLRHVFGARLFGLMTPQQQPCRDVDHWLAFLAAAARCTGLTPACSPEANVELLMWLFTPTPAPTRIPTSTPTGGLGPPSTAEIEVDANVTLSSSVGESVANVVQLPNSIHPGEAGPARVPGLQCCSGNTHAGAPGGAAWAPEGRLDAVCVELVVVSCFAMASGSYGDGMVKAGRDDHADGSCHYSDISSRGGGLSAAGATNTGVSAHVRGPLWPSQGPPATAPAGPASRASLPWRPPPAVVVRLLDAILRRHGGGDSQGPAGASSSLPSPFTATSTTSGGSSLAAASGTGEMAGGRDHKVPPPLPGHHQGASHLHPPPSHPSSHARPSLLHSSQPSSSQSSSLRPAPAPALADAGNRRWAAAVLAAAPGLPLCLHVYAWDTLVRLACVTQSAASTPRRPRPIISTKESPIGAANTNPVISTRESSAACAPLTLASATVTLAAREAGEPVSVTTREDAVGAMRGGVAARGDDEPVGRAASHAPLALGGEAAVAGAAQGGRGDLSVQQRLFPDDAEEEAANRALGLLDAEWVGRDPRGVGAAANSVVADGGSHGSGGAGSSRGDHSEGTAGGRGSSHGVPGRAAGAHVHRNDDGNADFGDDGSVGVTLAAVEEGPAALPDMDAIVARQMAAIGMFVGGEEDDLHRTSEGDVACSGGASGGTVDGGVGGRGRSKEAEGSVTTTAAAQAAHDPAAAFQAELQAAIEALPGMGEDALPPSLPPLSPQLSPRQSAAAVVASPHSTPKHALQPGLGLSAHSSGGQETRQDSGPPLGRGPTQHPSLNPKENAATQVMAAHGVEKQGTATGGTTVGTKSGSQVAGDEAEGSAAGGSTRGGGSIKGGCGSMGSSSVGAPSRGSLLASPSAVARPAEWWALVMMLAPAMKLAGIVPGASSKGSGLDQMVAVPAPAPAMVALAPTMPSGPGMEGSVSARRASASEGSSNAPSRGAAAPIEGGGVNKGGAISDHKVVAPGGGTGGIATGVGGAGSSAATTRDAATSDAVNCGADGGATTAAAAAAAGAAGGSVGATPDSGAPYSPIKRLYSSPAHGLGMNRLLAHVSGYTHDVLLLIVGHADTPASATAAASIAGGDAITASITGGAKMSAAGPGGETAAPSMTGNVTERTGGTTRGAQGGDISTTSKTSGSDPSGRAGTSGDGNGSDGTDGSNRGKGNDKWGEGVGWRRSEESLSAAAAGEGSQGGVDASRVLVGVYLPGGFQVSDGFYGTRACCLFILSPVTAVYKSSGRGTNFMYSFERSAASRTGAAGYAAKRVTEGIAVGGASPHQPRLALSRDFTKLVAHHWGRCSTYEGGPVLLGQGYAPVEISVAGVEVLGLGGERADADQRVRQAREELLLEQRRKVGDGRWQRRKVGDGCWHLRSCILRQRPAGIQGVWCRNRNSDDAIWLVIHPPRGASGLEGSTRSTGECGGVRGKMCTGEVSPNSHMTVASPYHRREGAAPDARRKRMLQLAVAAQGGAPAVQQSSGFLQTAFNGVLKLLFRKVGSKIIREAIKREQGLQALLKFNSPLKVFNMGGLQSYLGTKGARVARAVRIGIRVVRIVMMVAYVIPKGLEEFDVMELAAGTAADGYDRTHDAIVGIEGDEDEELAALAAAGAVEEELSVDDEFVYF
eukprot:jgi/Mesvir1/20719/Mv14913-RA.1